MGVLALAYAACSSFESSPAPPTNDAQVPDSPENDAAQPDAAVGALPDIAAAENWSTFNVASVLPGPTFAGGVFDGRHVYLVPKDGRTIRYDTTLAFGDGTSWTPFDLTPLIGPSKSMFGGTFDGRYVYYAPDGTSNTTPSTTAARFDTQLPFAKASSWQTFSTSALFDAGAGGASGSYYDGTKVVFVPGSSTLADDGGTDGPSFSTRAVFAEHTPGASFANAAAWKGTEGSSLVSPMNESIYNGVAYDGTYAYEPSAFASRFARVKLPGACEVFDLQALTGKSNAGYLGPVFDGRYLYLPPTFDSDGNGIIPNSVTVRYDTKAPFDAVTSYEKLDLETIKTSAKGYAGGVFDGRFVYFAPAFSSIIMRVDTTQPFGDTAAWTYFDAAAIAQTQAFIGAVYDGQYVYFIPNGGGIVLRFKARNERTAPKLPASFL